MADYRGYRECRSVLSFIADVLAPRAAVSAVSWDNAVAAPRADAAAAPRADAAAAHRADARAVPRTAGVAPLDPTNLLDHTDVVLRSGEMIDGPRVRRRTSLRCAPDLQD